MRYSVFKKQAHLIKNRLKTLQTQIPELEENAALTDLQIAKLKNINENVVKQNVAFDGLVNKLFRSETLCEDIDDDELSKLQDDITELYITIHSTCDALIPPTVPAILDHTTASNASVHNEGSLGIRLPRLNLGTFSGQTDKWIAFHSLYENSVHKNNNISEVEKFTYLLSSLSGEPLKLVKSLPVTAVHYNIAWQTLLRRYHNSRALISLHVNNILDIPAVSQASVKNLRNFLSSYHENISALEALEHDVTNNCLILTSFLLRKFDYEFRSKFEHSRTDTQVVPKIKEFVEFIEKECSQLEAADLASSSCKPRTSNAASNSRAYPEPKNYNPRPQNSVLLTSESQNCAYCNSTEHIIFRCPEFTKLSPEARFSFVKGKHLCTNCMGRHTVSSCKSTRNCFTCGRRHHTSLHLPNDQPLQIANRNKQPPASDTEASRSNHQNQTKPAKKSVDNNKVSESSAMVSTFNQNNTTVLLATALVKVAYNGHTTIARAVLDSAAQHSFMSEACASLLHVPRTHADHSQITGIASFPVKTKGLCHITLGSLHGCILASDHPVLILDKITSDLPRAKVEPSIKSKLSNLVLADPAFDNPAPIDLLIGADLFGLAMRDRSFSLGENMPTVFDTMFGYVLLGSTPVLNTQPESACGIVTLLCMNDSNLLQSIQKFWTLEEPPCARKNIPLEQECEHNFLNTHARSQSGRYIVRLPLKESTEKLGDSSKNALRMFHVLEKRLSTNSNLKIKYHEFMQDYEATGHMVEIPKTSVIDKPNFFLPHHPVLRDDKLRVVFNASAPTTTGISLNDILFQGAKLHNEIPDIILHFRRHKIVFSCDIKQMFRQIVVHEDDQPLQLIYWREDPTLPLKIYQLTTVTYGMSCSPWIANRVIQKLIEDEGHHYPAAASALKQQIYVDDALLGSDTLKEALQLQRDITGLLSKGGFSLRKWTSNCAELLDAVPPDHRGIPLQFPSLDQPLCNILGLKWLPELDAFSYIVLIDKQTSTKRSVLSAIARIYDPMGWLTPVVFWAKSLMQYLWTLGLKWDDPIPHDVAQKWNQFINDLPELEKIQVPRHLGITANNSATYQLHGFSDASELGFSACVYLRVENKNAEVSVFLLIGKSRVAPLKRVSLPRLELCGAHMLSNLINYCRQQLRKHIDIDDIVAWCDSTVALAWIQTPPYRLKTYVANRVAEIQEIAPPAMWSHIPSKENPADCASRGLLPSSITNHDLWWSGPKWLSQSSAHWPQLDKPQISEESLPEMKKFTLTTLVTTDQPPCDFIQKFSSWLTLIHVTAYILRFVQRCRKKSKNPPNTTFLTLTELKESTNVICRIVQQDNFAHEISALKKQEPCSSRISKLAPFLDEQGTLRVGGRLKNASLKYHTRHPILLPKKHHVVNLIIDYYHKFHLHAGPQQLQSLLSQRFWILSARDVIRSRIHRCITCFRTHPPQVTPFMGDLPKVRVTPSRPFASCGSDYAGPFVVKPHRLRKIQSIKVYLCIFICMATKAVHLETVSDLSSESFIATLTRFASRRGLPAHLYTDCGTTYVGADRQLKTIFEELMKTPDTQRFAEERSITFHFIPPSAPHQGGLWERAVRSAKHHLKRVIGTQTLTIEEFTTLTTRVEAMLNSRPLTQLSADPSELSPLTPGHFLTGGPLITPVEHDLQRTPMNRLRRWQLVQSMAQSLWSRWKLEYLHTLHQRSKWTKKNENLQTGQLVVIHDSNSPPLLWRLGRIIATSPGADGIVRVVTIKTQTGIVKRPTVKVSPLPIN